MPAERTTNRRPKIYWKRSPDAATLILLCCRGLGVTLWRYGAVSVLWNGDAPLQLVFGDWWQGHPEVKRARLLRNAR